jgi:N-acetylneuraminic acid mutarotase
MRTLSVIASLALLLTACTPGPNDEPPWASTAGGIPDLPLAVSNNAVASARVNGETRLYSFMGLGKGKTWLDITRRAFEFSGGHWRDLPEVPVADGRLASVAATAGGQVYLFGGYTVAEDGHEISTSEVLRFDPETRTYTPVAPMPLPVDDSVALVRDDRWIYLISGWHMDRNVADVQVYDTGTGTWAKATDFPGSAVFGHAGAMLGDALVVCDGVTVQVSPGEKRGFAASDECWHGRVASDDPRRIQWRRIAAHPGPPRYRMGAAADPISGRLLFAGGSENPYNYDGVGYDGNPTPASARVQAYDVAGDTWHELPDLPVPSMDHRGLPAFGDGWVLIGGMRNSQDVSAGVLIYRP